MLDSFRKANQSWIIKIFFAFLVLSFVSWGVGDVIRQRISSTPAISVGSREYSPEEVADRFRRDVDRMGQMFGQKLSQQDALKFGLLQQTVRQMVDGALLDQAATRLGLGVDEETLRRTIATIPAFQSQLKIFDKTTYQRVLSSMQLTEKRFIAMERSDLARSQLIKTVTSGVMAPKALAAPIYQYQAEKRVAEFLRIEADKMPNVAPPDEDTLKKYYDEHKAQFQQPELRAATALIVRAADLAAGVQISDQDIEKSYETRLGEFQKPEKRQIEQVLFTDQAAALAFYDSIIGGKDFTLAAKQAGLTVTDLGSVTKTEMPLAELSEPAFAGRATGVIAPVQSPLGWHVLRVAAITPGNTKPLSDVRGDIVKALVRDEATNRLYSLSTKLEDSIGGGNDIEETAKTLGLTAIKIPLIDAEGRDEAGKDLANPALNPILATLFQTVQGGTSDVLPLPGNDGYYVLHVDKVTPTSIRPFETAKAQIAASWQSEQKAAAARAQAQAMADRAVKGEPLAQLACTLKLETTRPFLRAGGAQVPPAMAAEMFRQSAVGGVAVVTSGADSLVVRLKEIQAADPEGAGFVAARAEIANQLTEDLMQQYTASLRKEIGAQVNMSAINQQFAK